MVYIYGKTLFLDRFLEKIPKIELNEKNYFQLMKCFFSKFCIWMRSSQHCFVEYIYIELYNKDAIKLMRKPNLWIIN
jgi:hypothetical protein